MSHVTRPDDSLVPSRSRDGDYDIIHTPGLTKREYFAALAMQGVLSGLTVKVGLNLAEVALASVNYADALIAELNK